jgi:hypothetical protein
MDIKFWGYYAPLSFSQSLAKIRYWLFQIKEQTQLFGNMTAIKGP